MSDAASPVVLHVYDLSQGLARQLSQTFLGKAIDAVYHTGIVVYGTEYWFGGGIESGHPGRTQFGPPMQVIPLGRTEIPKDVFFEFLDNIRPNFSVNTYSLLRHNCNNFSDEVANFLVGRGIPSHILSLPHDVMSSPQGALLGPLLQQLETSMKFGGQPQPPHRIISPLENHFPASLPSPAPSSTQGGTAPQSSSAQPLPVAPRPNPVPDPVSGGFSAQPGRSTGLAPPSTRQAENDENTAQVSKQEASSPASEISPKASSSTTVNMASQTATAADAAKDKLHAEIAREFAALTAAGGIGASEAAAAAVRRVMARYGVAKQEACLS